jgi:hypothetical protein
MQALSRTRPREALTLFCALCTSEKEVENLAARMSSESREKDSKSKPYGLKSEPQSSKLSYHPGNLSEVRSRMVSTDKGSYYDNKQILQDVKKIVLGKKKKQECSGSVYTERS